jgi:hypothetical protein
MAQAQISDVVVLAEFTAYQVENSMVSSAFYQSGVIVPNGEISAQLQAGAQQFTAPFCPRRAGIGVGIPKDHPATASTSQPCIERCPWLGRFAPPSKTPAIYTVSNTNL